MDPRLSSGLEILATAGGIAYVVLAALRRRSCWIAGALSAVLLGVVSFAKALPMQAGLQVFYVGVSVYGYWNWSRSQVRGELPVGYSPMRWHLVAWAIVLPLSWFNAVWLDRNTAAAWPWLDSLTTWFSVYATWLAARARIDNWVYWIVIDGILVYLYYMQDASILALQFLLFTGLALGGFLAWRRRLQRSGAPP